MNLCCQFKVNTINIFPEPNVYWMNGQKDSSRRHRWARLFPCFPSWREKKLGTAQTWPYDLDPIISTSQQTDEIWMFQAFTTTINNLFLNVASSDYANLFFNTTYSDSLHNNCCKSLSLMIRKPSKTSTSTSTQSNTIQTSSVNTLRPRQNGRHFADDTFKLISVNENVRILIKISLKFVPKGPINNIAALVQIMACRRPGDKPLSEPMIVILLTHIW